VKILKGAYKGVELASPSDGSVRPTVDHFKKHILRIAEEHKPKVVWDLYSGTGGVGIELMSNFAVEGIFVEQLGKAMDCIKLNVAECRLKNPQNFTRQKWTFFLEPVEQFLKTATNSSTAAPDLVFLDPPYGKDMLKKIVPLLASCALVKASTRILIEHVGDEKIIFDSAHSFEIREETYGPKTLTLLKVNK
jgi:16S rRNA (guanine966-N2)-methyltransferase